MRSQNSASTTSPRVAAAKVGPIGIKRGSRFNLYHKTTVGGVRITTPLCPSPFLMWWDSMHGKMRSSKTVWNNNNKKSACRTHQNREPRFALALWTTFWTMKKPLCCRTYTSSTSSRVVISVRVVSSLILRWSNHGIQAGARRNRRGTLELDKWKTDW